jgi:hypothetical protein
MAVATTETGAGPGHTMLGDHRAARSTDQTTPPAPLGRGAHPALDYQLLTPPNYDNIVGGAAPSPIASLFLGLGGALILIAALLSLGGTDTTQWWITGAILAAIGVFLAAFISRR